MYNRTNHRHLNGRDLDALDAYAILKRPPEERIRCVLEGEDIGGGLSAYVELQLPNECHGSDEAVSRWLNS